jgi:hypothetical protein
MSTAPKETTQAKGNRTWQSYVPIAILVVLVAIGLAATAAGSIPGKSGTVQYGCITATTMGNTVDLSTTGLIHHVGAEYYITCAEGAAEPLSSVSVSCLTISPKTITSPYPSAAPAFWYVLSATGGTIAIQGAASNSTIVTQPTSAYVAVTCG